MRYERAKSARKRAMCIFFAKKKRKICKIDCFCRIFASLKATGALVQLVRMPACHAGGRWFESCTHRKTRKQSAPGFFCFYPTDLGSVENSWGYIMHCCRIVNGTKNKNIKTARRFTAKNP